MIRHVTTVAAAALVEVCLSSCSSQPARYYTLSPVSAETKTPLAISVSVGPVTIPEIDDSALIMLTVGPNEVRPNDFARWASPLRDNIGRAVADNLVALLGTPRVTLASDTSGAPADYRIAVDVERFDSVLGQAAVLDAVWTVRRTADGVVRLGRTTVREPTQGTDVSALAAAHSRAVEHLSAEVAEAIRNLAAGT